MKRVGAIATAALLLGVFTAAETPSEKAPAAPAEAASSGSGWAEEQNAKGLVIHSRTREGSSIKEFKGMAMIDAPPSAVFAVLSDTEAFPSFMPYTSECRVLKRDKDSVVAYQRLELPLISDRDYTLRSEHARWQGPDGLIYRIRWEPANNLGPAPTPGVMRVGVCEGGWLLEPQGPKATRATYTIYTDSGGAVPPMIANSGGKVAIRKIFDAIRKQVREPKYAAGISSATEARNRAAE